MSSMPCPPDQAPESELEDRSLRLPVHGNTAAAEDMRVRLVLAADLDGETVIDASEVESVGQAVLQTLVAARTEARLSGQPFTITNPSPAFVDRVQRCGLAEAIGLPGGDMK
jgi:anti-anti-sigma regulatory factor